MSEPRRYSFGPIERRGLVAGLGAAQLGAAAAGAALALAAARAWPGGPGLGVAASVLAVAAWAALWPVSGRPLVAWVVPAGRFAWRRLRGPSLARPAPSSRDAAGPWSLAASGSARRGRRRLAVGPAPPGLRLESASWGSDASIAVIRDLRAGTFAAVLPVKGRAFCLVDRDDQERRLAAWGGLLAALARNGSSVARIQWVERTVAGDGHALERYLAEAGVSAADSEWAGAARASYEEVVTGAGPTTVEHQVLVVIAVNPRRASKSMRFLGGGRGAVMEMLGREVRLVQGQMRSADLCPAEPLEPAELVRELLAATGEGSRGWPWAMASDEAWSQLRRDGSWHATYWVAQWPRVDVGPDFLAPLLLSTGRRSVSMVMGPVPPDRAARQVESARTADMADDELRAKAGFISTARRRRQVEGVERREAELAEGNADYRFCAYVTVSAASRVELEAAAGEVEQAASQSHLELRRLYGQQAEAFTWTLPLGRGLA